MMRVRVRFSKVGKIRFTSHRDLCRMWERAIRRIDLPVAYSQGFSPHPKLHFGLALPTGAESRSEFLDIDLRDGEEGYDLAGLVDRVNPALPAGVLATAAQEIPFATMSLQEAVVASTWQLTVMGGDEQQLDAAAARLLAATELMTTRQRKGQNVTDDIRPYIIDLSVTGPTEGGIELECELGTRPRGLRPSELVAALGPPFSEGRICRTHQWTQHDGARQEPLAESATSAPHVHARAS